MYMWSLMRQKGCIFACMVSAVLMAKFIVPQFLYIVPMGYDAGMYRYLFQLYASVDSWLALPVLPVWAKEQSPVLIWFIGRLVYMGIPVDWFLHWIWSLTLVLLPYSVIRIWYKEQFFQTALPYLSAVLLSYSYYTAFTYMYWKAIVALPVLVFALFALQKNRAWTTVLLAIVLAGLHLQTIFLFFCTAVVWWLYTVTTKKITIYQAWQWVFLAIASGIFSLVWYAQSISMLQEKILYLLQGSGVNGGAYPPVTHMLLFSVFILFLSVVGVIAYTKKHGIRIWQVALIVTMVIMAFRLLLYRRFYIQFDFLLLPFAAHGLMYMWGIAKKPIQICIISTVVVGILALFLQVFTQQLPISEQDFLYILELQRTTVPYTTLIVPENASAHYLKGWLPHISIVAPGLLGDSHSMDAWNLFLNGDTKAKMDFLAPYGINTAIVILPTFFRLYGAPAEKFVAHPCFLPVEGSPLLHIVCH